jgi:hypothetical protein
MHQYKKSAVKHEDICLFNPENRTCRTCKKLSVISGGLDMFEQSYAIYEHNCSHWINRNRYISDSTTDLCPEHEFKFVD